MSHTTLTLVTLMMTATILTTTGVDGRKQQRQRRQRVKRSDNSKILVEMEVGVGAGEATPDDIAEKVRETGMARVDNVLDRTTSAAVYEMVLNGLPEHPLTHHNLHLPLTGGVLNATEDVLNVTAPVLDRLFGGDSVLYELCSLVNLQGATRQRTHADFHYVDVGREKEPSAMYSLMVALHDVTVDMGPTEIFPNTHTKEKHDELCSQGCDDEIMEGNYIHAHLATLKAGDVLILDSKIVHRGGPSSHPNPRAYMWLSFLSLPERAPPGSPPTIAPAYQSQFVTSKRTSWLGAPQPPIDPHRGSDEDVSGTPYSTERLLEMFPKMRDFEL